MGAPYPGTYAALGCGSIGGYAANSPVNTGADSPGVRAGDDAMARRCEACHQGKNVLPKTLADERKVSFWRFDVDDPALRMSRHIVFNVSRPEKSLLVLAPLAEAAGGLGLCRDTQNKPAAVFASTADPDYQKLLAMAMAGKQNLDAIKRFDMPGFRPNGPYLREMKRYGVIPANQPDTTPVDPYALDRRYWESLWYHAPAQPQ